MNIRENFEAREKSFMSQFGCLSSASRGRQRPEPPCPIRTRFQQDRDRILYSNAFKRLKYKTQVFLSPMGDYYRTRLTHTLEVAQVARTMARAMLLNEDLTEAIALGHDLGHPPFGHSGETALKENYSPDFSHHQQGLRVVDILENNGEGLNLTHEVRDGIVKHTKGRGQIIPEGPAERAITAEGQVTRVADIMAYLNHDLEDALRSGVITEGQIPSVCLKTLGRNHFERGDTMIRDLIVNSRQTRDGLQVKLSSGVHTAMTVLRQFLHENVYRSPQVHNEFVKSKKIVSELYAFYLDHPGELKNELVRKELVANGADGPSARERVACDLIASMTDRYALDRYADIFFPSPQV